MNIFNYQGTHPKAGFVLGAKAAAEATPIARQKAVFIIQSCPFRIRYKQKIEINAWCWVSPHWRDEGHGVD
jgi:hypothetical protein